MNQELETQWYEIEIESTTYRTYKVKAESQDKAEEIAYDEMDADWEISGAWKDNAKISHIEHYYNIYRGITSASLVWYDDMSRSMED